MPRKKRRRTRRSVGPALPPGMQRVPPPKTRLKPLLQLLADVPQTAERALLAVEPPGGESEQRLVMFDIGVLLRACNALKAIRLLCEQAHWEFAAATARQLFELALNMEYLAEKRDREAAIFRYCKYGMLQTVRQQHLNLLYNQKTGRPIDTERLAVLESMLERTFPEFRSVDAKGKVHWKPSWSGHSARYLAERSKHPLRADQYELLFSTWSEQAHGAPVALLDNMFPRGIPVEEIVASDDTRIAETVTVATTLFLELWVVLPHAPQVDPAQRLDWTRRMVEQAQKHGAPPSASKTATTGKDD